MTIERIMPSGDIYIAKEVYGTLIENRYNGYTKAEAIRLFRQKVRDYKATLIQHRSK